MVKDRMIKRLMVIGASFLIAPSELRDVMPYMLKEVVAVFGMGGHCLSLRWDAEEIFALKLTAEQADIEANDLSGSSVIILRSLLNGIHNTQ